MSDADYSYFERYWRVGPFDFSQVARRKPIRLRDREALRVLIREFHRYTSGPVDVWVNGSQYTDPDADEVLEAAPSQVHTLHLQSGSGDVVVHISALRGGQTWIVAADGGTANAEALRGLAAVVEAQGRALGWRRAFGRARWPAIQALAPSLLRPDARDAIVQRRADLRNAVISGVLGLIGGVLGSILTLAASGSLGGR